MKSAALLVLFSSVLIFSSCKEKAETETESKTQKRPNIIFLMDDQHRYDALGMLN